MASLLDLAAPVDKLLEKYKQNGGCPADKYHELMADIASLNQSIINSNNNSLYDPTDVSSTRALSNDRARVGINRNIQRKQIYGLVVWNNYESKKIYIDVPPYNTKVLQHPEKVFTDAFISSGQTNLEDYEDMVFYAESWGVFGGDSPLLRRLAVVEIPENYPNHVKSNPTDAKYLKLYSEQSLLQNDGDSQPFWESPYQKLLNKVTAIASAAAAAAAGVVQAAVDALGSANSGPCAPGTESLAAAPGGAGSTNPPALKLLTDDQFNNYVDQGVSTLNPPVGDDDFIKLFGIIKELTSSQYKVPNQAAIYEFYLAYSADESGDSFVRDFQNKEKEAESPQGKEAYTKIKEVIAKYPEGGGKLPPTAAPAGSTSTDMPQAEYSKIATTLYETSIGPIYCDGIDTLDRNFRLLESNNYKGATAVYDFFEYFKKVKKEDFPAFLESIGTRTVSDECVARLKDLIGRSKKYPLSGPPAKPPQPPKVDEQKPPAGDTAGGKAGTTPAGSSATGGAQKQEQKPAAPATDAPQPNPAAGGPCDSTPVPLGNMPAGDVTFPQRTIQNMIFGGDYRSPPGWTPGKSLIQPDLSQIKSGQLVIGGKGYDVPGLRILNFVKDGVYTPPDKRLHGFHPNKIVDKFVIHETAGRGSSRQVETTLYVPGPKWDKKTKSMVVKDGVSAVHFICDAEGTMLQPMDLLVFMWHANGASRGSVGVEITSPVFSESLNLKTKPGPKDKGAAVYEWVPMPASFFAAGYKSGILNLPTYQQCEATTRLINFLLQASASNSIPGIQIKNFWHSLRPGGMAVKHENWPYRSANSRYGSGVLNHHYIGEHSDGFWPYFYAYLRIVHNYTPQAAWAKLHEALQSPITGTGSMVRVLFAPLGIPESPKVS